ncbi:aminoglycoside phosphotransferase (APT) family kinase protein [Nakamurella sp. UYEF19]|uniref:aminoglycoside phosphotransferase family protein n=1 Tax=Nakamurella sp. UYEF19 TaxID=1756392 RepID=UPI00339794C3
MEISSETVRQLIREQLPQWAELEVTPVLEQGNDNRTFRLGQELAVRLPSAEGYVAGVAKEDLWLPVMAQYLSTGVPVTVATGVPSKEYPYPWSVRRWITGTTPDRDSDLDRVALAKDVGLFLCELRAVPPGDGPAAGAHSFYRGTHPSVYGDQVQQAIGQLANRVDVTACHAIWAEAMRTAWSADPVWFHGDVAPGNILTDRGRMIAVIDFGTCGVGDPACDLVIAWTVFTRAERGIFRDAAALPEDAWVRGRGWALWKALVTLCRPASTLYSHQARALEELVADYRDT